MRLAMMLPIGVGALGDGRPVRWTELREGIERFAPGNEAVAGAASR